MNIGESNAWFSVMRALETDASLETIARGYRAAAHLTAAANKTIGAGPSVGQIETFLDIITETLTTAAEDHGHVVVLPDRPIETVTPAGDVL